MVTPCPKTPVTSLRGVFWRLMSSFGLPSRPHIVDTLFCFYCFPPSGLCCFLLETQLTLPSVWQPLTPMFTTLHEVRGPTCPCGLATHLCFGSFVSSFHSWSILGLCLHHRAAESPLKALLAHSTLTVHRCKLQFTGLRVRYTV